MAEAIKVLGQSAPSVTTLTTLYTVPGATEAVCSTLVVCNRNSNNRDVRASVAIAGAADSVEQYILYDVKVKGNESLFLTIGISLAATDVVRVYTDGSDVSFSLFGTEVS